MKISNALVALFALILCSCGSDDNQNAFLLPADIRPAITIDADAIIAMPAFSDITALVDFGQGPGQSAADYTSEVKLNESFTLPQPTGLITGDEFFYAFVDFYDEGGAPVPFENDIVGDYLELMLPAGATGTRDSYYGMTMVPAYAYRVINVDDTVDTTWKYTIDCYVIRGGTTYGPFSIDPKIRMKSRS